ncbi:MAG: leucine-rich repeat protein [Muribaculaceae bacterium]|nr:leucine-rich repeat protein [Muribaculaceae bacterium]
MKKLILLILGVLFALPGIAQTFKYEYDGQPLWYEVTNVDAKTVMVSDFAATDLSGKLTIPETVVYDNSIYTVTSIGDDAFYVSKSMLNGDRGANITEVFIPNTITSIGTYAFYKCKKLSEVNIPNSVTSIGVGAFAYCSNLNSINVNPTNTYYSSNDGILFEDSGKTLVQYPGKKEGIYVVPSSVTTICPCAFSGCHLTKISIPESVTEILGSTFAGSELTEIILPNSINKIDGAAFIDCKNLVTITLPKSVTVIGSSAFEGCENLVEISIPPLVTTIYPYTFNGCYNLAKIDLPNSLVEIKNRAFSFCRPLDNIVIPKHVTSIDREAFYMCNNLSDVTCLAVIPPAVSSNSLPFTQISLRVNTSAYLAYKDANYWKNSKKIYSLDKQIIEWNQEFSEIIVGDEIELTAKSTSELPVEYTTSDPEVAEIDGNSVRFIGVGEVTITASQSGNDEYEPAESISHSFVVNPRPKDDSLTLNVSKSNLKPEETLQLVIEDYEWTSSDEKVATVSESGLVTAVAGGDAVITLSRKSDGATLATCMIKVDVLSSTSELNIKKDVEINCLGNEVRIKGAATSSTAWVYDMNGKKIYSGLDRTIRLDAGIYIVSIEGSQLKVIIK